MAEGRRADSARRRQRVLKALSDTVEDGTRLNLSRIAQRARVDRSFLYRHPDLLAQLHAMQAQPPGQSGFGSAPSLSSLQADLLNAQERATRLATRIHQLEQRHARDLGQQTWRDSGLGAPDDIARLEDKIVSLEQQVVDLRLQIDERDQDLDAARAANRELMSQLNLRMGKK